MTRAGSLSDAVGQVLREAVTVYRDDPATARTLQQHLDRLGEPLRVAIAGKVKAGKSTLLNALVGERIAPTDAGECTQVVTWYRHAHTPGIVLHATGGSSRRLPVRRADDALVVDLAGHPADQVEQLSVDWPSQRLRTMTLIDTPGMASLSTAVAQRSVRFLKPDDDTPTEADAVVYLMRHLHAADARFLEAFRDQGVARAASVNTVGVISRADEIGGGRVDAMSAAKAVAARYRREPVLRTLCQNVVAVAGLVAQTGRTLRQREFAVLAELSRLPPAQLDRALITTDRFLAESGAVATVPVPERRALLDRFGVYGIRLSTTLIREGVAHSVALAGELVRHSGLEELHDVLRKQFADRADLLKARSGLLALDGVLRAHPRGGSDLLAGEVERILAGAHGFAELRLLGAIRSGGVVLPAQVVQDAERLLGDAGTAAAERLGLPPDAGPDELRDAATEALTRWQVLAENPMTSRSVTDACRVVVRTCEGLLVSAAV